MPPKARGRGNNRSQPQPSDYETDALVDDPPQQTTRSIDDLNLSALRRNFSDVVSILHVTRYTVLYSYDIKEERWEKVGIEGSLFICELSPSPMGASRFAVIIPNRRSLENYYWEILSDEHLDITEQYIIVRGDCEEQYHGIWVYEDPEDKSTFNARADTAAKIHALAVQVAENNKAREQALQNGLMQAAGDTDESIPMGRQLSLSELFGQQREQDAGWGVHDHHSATPNQGPYQPPTHPGPDVLGALFTKAKQEYNGAG